MSARKLVSASFANLLIPISGLLVSPFLSRELGPDGRGVYAALTLPIVVWGWIGTYGLQDSLSYHIRQGRLSSRAAARVSLLAMAPLSVLAVGLLAVLGIVLFPDTDEYREFLVLALFAPLHVLSNLFIGALTGNSDIRGLNLVKVVPALVRTGLVVVACLAFELNAYQAGLIFAGSVLAGLVIGLLRLRNARDTPTVEHAAPRVPTASLIRYALACLPGVLAAVSSARLGQIIGLPLIGARELGYYAVAVSVAEIPMVIATAARSMLLGRQASGDTRAATQVARLAVLVSGIACVGLALVANVAVPLFFGAAFEPAVTPTIILCAATVLYTCMTIYSAALLAYNRPGWSSAALVAGSVAGVAALLAFAPFGAVGAAVASLVGYAVTMIIAAVGVRRVPELRSLRMLTVPYDDDVQLIRNRIAMVTTRLRRLTAAATDRTEGGSANPRAKLSLLARLLGAGRRHGVGTVGVAALIVLAWLRIVSAQTMHLLIAGRPTFNSREVVGSSMGDLVGDGLTFVFLLLAAGLAAHGIWRRRPTSYRWLAVALATFVALEVGGLLHGHTPSAVAAAFPLAATAIWAQRPRSEVLGVVGVLGGLTAAGSMLFAVIRPDLALLTGEAAGDKKVLLGGLLTGPYLHSNVLGLALALSVAFVFLLRRPALRWACLAVILGALVWTGSRTSQVAAVAVIGAYVLIRLLRGRSWPASLAFAAGALLVGAVPLITSDPASFSERGRIWTVLLDRWAESPIVGWGQDVFDEPAVTAALGGQFNHGHNVMVQVLVVGGLLALVPFLLLCFVAWRRAAALCGAGQPVPLLFLVAFAHVSWLEASHVSTTLTGYVTWLPLLVIALAGPAATPVSRDVAAVAPPVPSAGPVVDDRPESETVEPPALLP
ncbi:O-antigen ligase family protein [Micromonospora sp. RB23]